MPLSGASGTKEQFKTFGRNRYGPGRYYTDLGGVATQPVTWNEESSTFIEVLRKLQQDGVKEFERGHDSAEIITNTGKVVVTGYWTLLSTLETLAEIIKKGVNPDHVRWLYYGNDWSRDADEMHLFFVVNDEGFVLETCRFGSYEPLILEKDDLDDEPIWNSHPYLHEATEKYWYRRFYAETKMGQLMVLRPDEPILYHFERAAARDTARQIEVVTLVKLYRLTWLAVALLAGIAMPAYKTYSDIAAAIIFVDRLFRIWATRKIGQT